MRFLLILVALWLAFAGKAAFAVACNSNGIAPQNWNNTATWSCGAVPGAADTVTINNTHNITQNVAAGVTVTSVTINAGGTLTQSNALTTSGVLSIANTGIHNSSANLTVGGTTTLTGTLNITAGATHAHTGTVTINGTWNNSGNTAVTFGANLANNGTFTSGSGTQTFSAATATLSGTAALTTFSGALTVNNNLTVNTGAAGRAVTASGATTVGGNLTVTSGTLNFGANATVTGTTSVTGTLNITGGATHTHTGNVTINAGGTWNNSGNTAVSLGGNLTNVATGTFTSGSGAYTFTAATATLTGTGAITIAGSATFNGNLAVAAGTVSLGSAVSVTGTTAVTGTLNMTGGGTHTHTGNVTINAGGTWNNSGNSAVTFGGNLTVNNVFTSGTGTQTFTAATATLGGTAMTFNGNVTANNVTIANAVVVTNNKAATITGNLVGNNATATWTNAPTANNASLSVTGTVMATGVLNASCTAPNVTTVNYSGAAQTVKVPSGAPATYCSLAFSGSGVKTMPATAMTISNDFSLSGTATATALQALTIGRNVDIGAGTTFTTGAFSHSVAGNFTRTGTFTASAGSTIVFNGSSVTAQTLTGSTSFVNLTINNTGGGVTLGVASDVTLGAVGTLTLTNGVITTNAANTVITPRACNAPSVARTNGWVNGNLRKAIPAGASTCTYEIGDASNYAPGVLVFPVGTGAGSVTASTTAGEHPNIATSGIDSTADVNRYWTLTNNGVVLGGNYNATFTFVAGDVDGGADTSKFEIERWDGSAWNTTTAGIRTATSTQATGLSAFGDFVSGQKKFQAGTGTFNAFETATAAGAVTGVIKTRVAGTAFSLDVVAIVSGAQANNFSGNVTVDLIGNNTLGVSLDANNCPTTFSIVLAGFTAAISSGRSTVSFAAVANSWRDVRVRVRWPTSSPTVTSCSTDNFAIRPASITISALDATWETAGTTRTLANTGSSGGNVHKASTSAATTPRPFTLRATAVPASATNYDGSPATVAGFPSCGTLCTSVGTLSFTGGSWTGTGLRENATVNYSEAGTFNLQLEDTGYASVDNSDGSTAAQRTVPATATVEIGRFVPERFEFVASVTPPKLQTFGSSCGSRSFTYLGQRFWYATMPSATVKAVNAAGGTTTNYPISTSRPALSESYSDSGAPATLDTSAVGTPTLSAPGSGTATYAPDSGGTLAYQRSSTTPVAPFNAAAITLTVSASDSADNAANQGIISTPTPLVLSNILFDAGNEFRYGRMRLLNGAGPTTVDIPVTLSAEYYVSAGTGFTTNIADNCTSLIPKNFVLFGHQTNLAGSITTTNMVSPTAGSNGNVSISGSLALGVANLKLLKPTSSVTTGSVKICLDLDSAPGVGDTSCQAATPANQSYLQGPWSGSTNYDKDPPAQVNFGLYGAQPRNFIFFRENY